VNTHPFDLKLVAFCPKFSRDSYMEFRKRVISGEFFRNYVQTKAMLYRNLWNFAILSAILFWVHIALKILKQFTQVHSYVVCTLLRRHVHKKLQWRRYREEKPTRFVFGNSVFFTLGLVFTTPDSLCLLIWNFYKTFFIVLIEFWQRFEPQIRPTRFAINVLFITARAERKVRLCAKQFDFFPWGILIRLTWNLLYFTQIQSRFLRGISGKKYFGTIFQKFWAIALVCSKFRPTFYNFILGPYCAEKIQTSTFLCCLHPGKEASP